MQKMRSMTLKEKFHFAKLSLFNMRLLNDIQNDEKESVKKIIEDRAKKDNIRLPINILHQTSFLSHAYTNFVWLWETIKQNNAESNILESLKTRFEFSSNIEIVEIGDDRVLKEPKDFIRLIRNSISHGNVEVTEDFFIFYDENPRNRKKDYGKIKMRWYVLGKLSDDILFSVNDFIYN